MKKHSIHTVISLLGLALGTSPGTLGQMPAVHEEGMASWYGDTLNGQKAASGEIYDSEQLTAAHRTLPFGTKVLVSRLDSPKSIVVRINDRGPYIGARIIDLSYAAARRLEMTDPGLVPVSIQVVESPPAPPAGLAPVFGVQAGSYRNPENARLARETLDVQFGGATLRHDGEFYRVQVGQKNTQAQAETLAAAIRRSAKAFASAFVVRIDPAAR